MFVYIVLGGRTLLLYKNPLTTSLRVICIITYASRELTKLEKAYSQEAEESLAVV